LKNKLRNYLVVTLPTWPNFFLWSWSSAFLLCVSGNDVL
jgi:hypothetical protein